MDDRIVVWMAAHRVAPLDWLFVGVGTIEKLGAVWITLALVIGLLARIGLRKALALAVYTGLVTLAADSLSFLVKDMTHRARPFAVHPQIDPIYVVHSSSMPAGHAATAFAGAVLLTSVWPRLWPGFFLLAVLVGISRVYVGVHYPTDVLVGALIGSATGLAGIAVLRWGRRVVPPWPIRKETSEGAPNVST